MACSVFSTPVLASMTSPFGLQYTGDEFDHLFGMDPKMDDDIDEERKTLEDYEADYEKERLSGVSGSQEAGEAGPFLPDVTSPRQSRSWMSPRLAFKLYWCGNLLLSAMARSPERYLTRLPSIARPYAESPEWWSFLIECVRTMVEAVGDGRYPEPRCTGQLYGLYLLLDITRDVEVRGQDAAMRQEMANLPTHHMDSDFETAMDLALGDYDLHVLLTPDLAARLHPLSTHQLPCPDSIPTLCIAPSADLLASTTTLASSTINSPAVSSAAMMARSGTDWSMVGGSQVLGGATDPPSRGTISVLSASASLSHIMPSPCHSGPQLTAAAPSSPGPASAPVVVPGARKVAAAAAALLPCTQGRLSFDGMATSPSGPGLALGGSSLGGGTPNSVPARAYSTRLGSLSGGGSLHTATSLLGQLLHSLHLPSRKASLSSGACADKTVGSPTRPRSGTLSPAHSGPHSGSGSPIMGGVLAAARAFIHLHDHHPRHASSTMLASTSRLQLGEPVAVRSTPEVPPLLPLHTQPQPVNPHCLSSHPVPPCHTQCLHPADWFRDWHTQQRVEV